MKNVEILHLPNGHSPFADWLETLEITVQAKVMNFVRRLASGGAKKNIKALGQGVFEIKIDSGPGYRVYFGEVNLKTLLLLLGGDKSTQNRDIKQAKLYWRLYVSK